MQREAAAGGEAGRRPRTERVDAPDAPLHKDLVLVHDNERT
jgi:hypothetical protein